MSDSLDLIKKLLPNNFKEWLKTKLIKLNSKIIKNKNVSFSQAGEDSIIRAIFENKKNGFFVDVGAFHPMFISNTYYFYLYDNWRGINIDPRPGSKALFDKYRPEDQNLEIGISNKKEDLTYYFIDDTSSMNSFSKEFLDRVGATDQIKKEIRIKTKFLSEVFDEYLPKNKSIDFLSIDVEGFDLQVLMSNNWDKYRPELIIIECEIENGIEFENNEISKYLKNLNYQPVAVTYLGDNLRNVFFKNIL